ncbi:MAG: aminotransferase class V-fold PLP-dependent enzyme [Spirochaetaceae bacterium]|jgi:cysteine desulfurase|nr:aminotransferase class V-fold PLP-dependent enzyme [Spirochaetaceae bacterium]
MNGRRIYFDFAASSPQAFNGEAVLKDAPFGNPSSAHAEGRLAKNALSQARARCARALGVPEKTLYFTSGGSESNSIVILSQLLHFTTHFRVKEEEGGKQKKVECLTSAIEHPSVLRPFETLERFGARINYARPASFGGVLAESALKVFSGAPGCRFVSIQAVNNETGACSDIKGITAALRRARPEGLFIHSDCVQALGKTCVNLTGSGIDAASFSAHKIGGPRGIGLLYLKKPLEPLVKGGVQEMGLRGGTENTAGALLFAECMELYATKENLLREYKAAEIRMERLVLGLRSIKRCVLTPHFRGDKTYEARYEGVEGALFSPYIVSAAFEGIPGPVMARFLDGAGFAVSTGAACSQAGAERKVLLAMGVDEKTASCAVRFSQGYTTTNEEIDLLLNAIEDACASI